jgi:hypothetical protein
MFWLGVILGVTLVPLEAGDNLPPRLCVLCVGVLTFPAGVTFIMACLGLLAGLKPMHSSSTKRR